MKKAAFLILICIFLCSGCGNTVAVKDMKEEYIIDGTIVTVGAGKFFFTEMNTGKTEEVLIEEYDKPVGGTDIVSDGSHIYLFENGKWTSLPIDGYEIEEKPVRINEAVYFVAPDPEDDSEFPDRYIWTYRDGKIERFSYAVLDISSAILTFDNVLIYVEGNRIVYNDVVSGEQKLLVYGEHICWNEIGKSFFYNTNDGKLAVFYIDTYKRDIIDEKIDMTTSPIYDSYSNVLLLACDNPKNQFSYISPVLGFYYLDSNQLVLCDDYFKFVDARYKKDLNYLIFELYWD